MCRASEEERFDKLPTNTLRVTVDGSFNQGQSRVGWGFVVTRGDERTILHQSSGCLEGPKAISIINIAGEIEAARQGILYALEVLDESVIVVQYDYEGIKHWITGHWRPGNESAMSYWNKVAPYYQAGRIVFRHVNAHEHWANRIADQLAREACGLPGERRSRRACNRAVGRFEDNGHPASRPQGTRQIDDMAATQEERITNRLQARKRDRRPSKPVREIRRAGRCKPDNRRARVPRDLFGQASHAWPREVDLKRSLLWAAIAFVMMVLVAAAPGCSRCRHAQRGIKKTQQRIERTKDTLASCEAELGPENTYCKRIQVKLFKLREKYGVYMSRKDRYCK